MKPFFLRYSSKLSKAKRVGIKRGTLTGVSIGMLYFAMFGSYALTFWYGVRLVTSDSEDKLSPGDMMIVFYNVLVSAFALGTVRFKIPWKNHPGFPTYFNPAHQNSPSPRKKCIYLAEDASLRINKNVFSAGCWKHGILFCSCCCWSEDLLCY